MVNMDDNLTYRRLLSTIDSELREDDIKSLKFLCEPFVGTKKSSSNFSSGFDIFAGLEKNNKLSEKNMDYLSELLLTIGRVDLASLIDPDCYGSYSRCLMLVDPFRVMLFKLSEELSSEDLVRLRYLYGKVPKKTVINDGIDLLSVMLQHKAITQVDLHLLKSLLQEIDRPDLIDVVNSFVGENSLGHQELSHSVSCTEVSPVLESSGMDDMQAVGKLELSISGEELPDLYQGHCSQPPWQNFAENSSYTWQINASENDEPNQNSSGNDFHMKEEFENIPVSMEPAQAVTQADNLSEATVGAAFSNQVMPDISRALDDDYTPVDFYKMDAVPRGLCVIIDNQKFTPDLEDPEAVPNLGDREGSDKDSEALKNSFERLKFIVEVKINLTDTEIIHFLKNISAQSHAEYDCFICCILSHGGENHVFGVNGRKVQLGSITSMFRAQSCPSLARKPKLFFMASCRGKSHQAAVQDMFETDKPEIDFDSSEWVPNEADFLFGYSTVVNYVSYRSRSQGTFYISELTKVLDKYADRDELQKLLVRVNAAVNARIYSRQENGEFRVYKQTPAPQHTLTKQLKFL